MRGAQERKVTGRHVLIGVLIFFAVVLAANGAFVYLALDSWTGLSTRNAYQKGLRHNEILRAAQAQKALGWRAALEFEAGDARRGRLQATFRDERGDPVEYLTVTAAIRRPTHEGFDQDATLSRSGPGRYAVDLELPLAGQWDVRVSATSPHGARYEIEKRIWLR